MSWRDFWMYLGLTVLILGSSFYVHTYIEPSIPVLPAAHADEKPVTPDLYEKSDKEQEAEFCKQIMNGVPVHGANVSQVELHCMQF